MKLNPEDLAKITDFTLSHYNSTPKIPHALIMPPAAGLVGSR